MEPVRGEYRGLESDDSGDRAGRLIRRHRIWTSAWLPSMSFNGFHRRPKMGRFFAGTRNRPDILIPG